MQDTKERRYLILYSFMPTQHILQLVLNLSAWCKSYKEEEGKESVSVEEDLREVRRYIRIGLTYFCTLNSIYKSIYEPFLYWLPYMY